MEATSSGMAAGTATTMVTTFRKLTGFMNFKYRYLKTLCLIEKLRKTTKLKPKIFSTILIFWANLIDLKFCIDVIKLLLSFRQGQQQRQQSNWQERQQRWQRGTLLRCKLSLQDLCCLKLLTLNFQGWHAEEVSTLLLDMEVGET